jgi:tRNA threonylcarbamoyladenosine biosynthesis protein TsaB
MLILSLDTTTRRGSAAVVADGTVLAEFTGDPTLMHGQRLPGDLMRVLEQAGAAVDDVDLFAVAAGPGSFTGLRVGIAAVQGLATARERLVVPVSTLDALARTVDLRRGLVAAWVDAQRGEVFAGLYDSGRTKVADPTSAPAGATLDHWERIVGLNAVTFTGDGAVRYADVIRGRMGERAIVIEPAPLLAAAIALLAYEQRDRAVLPHAIVPLYVRRPDAELARARSRRGGV